MMFKTYFFSVGEIDRAVTSASEILKRKYIQNIGQQNLKSIHKLYRSKTRFYVDLAMASKFNVDDLITGQQSRHNEQLDAEKTITIDQLLNSNQDSNLVLIQGAGGVGKSYMMETAALHWAEGKIWKNCLLYTSPSPRDGLLSRMPSSA